MFTQIRDHRVGLVRDFIVRAIMPESHQKPKAMIERLTSLGGLVLAGLLALLPAIVVWDYGGVLPWTQWAACGAVTVLGLLSVPVIWLRRREYRPLQLVMPAIAGAVVVIAFAQSIPVFSSINRFLSPGVDRAYRDWVPRAIREELRDSEIAADANVAANRETAIADYAVDRHPTSVCSARTRQSLVMPIVVAAVLLISIFLVRDQRTLAVVLLITAFSGTAVAVFGLLDEVRVVAPGDAEKLITPTGRNAAPFGPFVNQNNAGGFLNMTLAATIGLLVWSIRMAARQTVVDPQYQIAPENAWERIVGKLSTMIRNLDGRAIGVLFMALIQIVGIAGSQSRGALVAAVAGGLVVAIQFASRNRTISPALVIGVTMFLIATRWMLIYLGLTDKVDARVDSIFTLSEGSQVGRIGLIADGISAGLHYLPGGSGLGTFEYAFLPYNVRTTGGSHFLHAESMPVEWFVEGGVWLIALIVAGVVAMMKVLSIMASHRRSQFAALTAMGWFLMVSQVVACCFDFGILLPANYLTAAILVGALLAMMPPMTEPSPSGIRSKRIQNQPIRSFNPIVPITMAAATGAALIGATMTAAGTAHDSFAILRIERWFESFDNAKSRVASLPPLTIETSQPSSDPQRDFMTAVYQLTREESVTEATKTASLRTDLPNDAKLDPETLIRLRTDPRLSVRRMMTIEKRSRNGQDDAILLGPGQDLATIRDARLLAISALVRCPLLPFVRIPLVKTDFVRRTKFGEDSTDATAELTLRLATDQVRLQPKNPIILEQMIRLCVVSPGMDYVGPFVKQLMEVAPDRFASIWPMIGGQADVDRFAEMIPDQIDAILRVAESTRVPEPIRKRMLDRASAILAKPNAGGLSEDEWAHASARVAIAGQDSDRAIESLEQAVRIAPSNGRYRDQLIQLLVQQKRYDEAITHLNRAIIQRPNDPSLLQTLKQVRDQE